MRRVDDWFRMAEASLKQARDSIDDGNYWASCFFCQQAAEFAVKGILLHMGVEKRGHSVHDLLEEVAGLGVDFPEYFRRYARDLDRHYLQSRYVNTYHAGAPLDYYRREDAEAALKEAEEIVKYFREKVEEG